MKKREELWCILGASCAALVSAGLLALVRPGFHFIHVFVGAIVAVLFLASTAVVAVLYRGSRDLTSAVLLTYIMKTSLVMMFLLQAPSVLQRTEVDTGYGILMGAIVYVGVIATIMVSRLRRRPRRHCALPPRTEMHEVRETTISLASRGNLTQ